MIRESTCPLFVQDGTLNHVFRVRNQRSYPVQILKARDSCVCLDPKYPKDVLAPGEEMPLTVTLRGTHGRQRATYWSILETDDPKSAEWAFRVDADFYPNAVADPTIVHVREMTDQTIVAINVHTYAQPNAPPRSIKSVDAGEKLRLEHGVKSDGVALLADGVTHASYALSLTPATSALDIGQHVERVICHLDDGERLEIPVRWSVEGVATPRPARLFFFLCTAPH